MSPSKPLTEKQRAKRRERRAPQRALEELAREIASTGLVRGPDGRVGYFVPAIQTGEIPVGEAIWRRM